MKAIICDRCGKVENEHYATEISYQFSCMGEADEQHLCVECSSKLREWMKEDA